MASPLIFSWNGRWRLSSLHIPLPFRIDCGEKEGIDMDTEQYDYRRYDRVWQRVSPTLEPYPGCPCGAGEMAQNTPPAAQPPAVSGLTPAQIRQESQLPGAEVNPCCMGSAAEELLDVLTGFIEGELSDRRYYLALLRCAPTWARQTLRTIADDEWGHAKRLMAVYYLITGQCYRPNVSCGHVSIDRWCPALRSRYHEEACGSLNYNRAAESTTDICLSRILKELGADEYRHSELIAALLERSLNH